jgi:hypothetical protein
MKANYYEDEEVKELVKFVMVLKGKEENYRGEVNMVVKRNSDKRKRKYVLETMDIGEFKNAEGALLSDDLINRESIFDHWTEYKSISQRI